jgi:hypothetical protein
LTPPGTTESALKDMKASVLDHRWTIEIYKLSGFRGVEGGFVTWRDVDFMFWLSLKWRTGVLR